MVSKYSIVRGISRTWHDCSWLPINWRAVYFFYVSKFGLPHALRWYAIFKRSQNVIFTKDGFHDFYLLFVAKHWIQRLLSLSLFGPFEILLSLNSLGKNQIWTINEPRKGFASSQVFNLTIHETSNLKLCF